MTNNPLKWVRPVITRPASFFSSEWAISFITLPLAMKRPVGYKQSEWAATCQTDEPELHQSVLQSVCGQNVSDSCDSTRLITHSELWIIWIVSRYQREKNSELCCVRVGYSSWISVDSTGHIFLLYFGARTVNSRRIAPRGLTQTDRYGTWSTSSRRPSWPQVASEASDRQQKTVQKKNESRCSSGSSGCFPSCTRGTSV